MRRTPAVAAKTVEFYRFRTWTEVSLYTWVGVSSSSTRIYSADGSIQQHVLVAPLFERTISMSSHRLCAVLRGGFVQKLKFELCISFADRTRDSMYLTKSTFYWSLLYCGTAANVTWMAPLKRISAHRDTRSSYASCVNGTPLGRVQS